MSRPEPCADVLEAAAGKLVEELVAGAVRAAVLQQINVEEAVAVEVEQSGPRADDLRHEVAARGAGVVDEVQADLVRHVLEPARIGRRRDDGRGFLAPGDEKKQESKGEKEKRRKGNEEKLKSLWFHPVSLFPFLHHFSSMLCVWVRSRRCKSVCSSRRCRTPAARRRSAGWRPATTTPPRRGEARPAWAGAVRKCPGR